MEGLGAAASVIGVVSIALQLIETVQQVHSFLTSLAEAPEEIQRLVENLALLGGVLQDVRSFAEIQQLHKDVPAMSSTVLVTLKACEKDLEPLKAIMQKAKMGYGSSRRVIRKWTSLKVVTKKKDVKMLEERLLATIHLLTLSMIANVSHISLSTHGRINILLANSPGAQTPHTASSFESKSESIDGAFKIYPCSTIMSRNLNTRSIRYGRFKLTSSTRELVSYDKQDQDQMRFGQRKTFSISARFLQYYFQLQVKIGAGWKHLFIVYQVVSFEDKIWKMCLNGDIPGLQQVFSKNLYSPFIVDQCGRTLIHWAAWYCNQADILMFLLELGIDSTLTTNSGSLPLEFANLSLDTCRALIHHGQNDPNMINYGRWIETLDPNAALFVLTQEEFCLEYQELERVHIFHRIATNFGEHVANNRSGYSTDWSGLLAQLLLRNFNLHSLDDMGMTPLDRVFLGCQYSDDALSRWETDSSFKGQQWLALLASVGIDVKVYIENEKHLHPQNIAGNHFLPMEFKAFHRLYVFGEEPNGIPTVSWEWAVSPDSPLRALLQEFKVMYLAVFGNRFVSYDPESWELIWPFDLSSSFENRWISEEKEKEEEMAKKQKKCETRWARQAERRERRRSHYKTPREYQTRRRGRFRVPGSWTEDKYTPINQPSDFSLSIPRWLVMSLIYLAGHFLFHIFLRQQNDWLEAFTSWMK